LTAIQERVETPKCALDSMPNSQAGIEAGVSWDVQTDSSQNY